MAAHQLKPVVTIPEEEMTIDQIKEAARLHGLTMDEWISRCVVEYTREAAASWADPANKAYFDIHKSQGPVNKSPLPRT